MSDLSGPGLDVSVFEKVIKGGDATMRSALAKQLAALYSDPLTATQEVAQVEPYLLQLALDEDFEVRRVLATALSDTHRINADIAFAIAADDDSLALPFLAHGHMATPQQLYAVFRVSDDARQCAIVSRPVIADETLDYAVYHASAAVVQMLLTNTQVKLDETRLRLIYKRFGLVADVVEALMVRSDLPLDIRITEARRGAVRMRQMMADKGWMAANDATDLCADAEDKAVMDVLLQAAPAQRAKAMAFMASKNLLTPAFLLRAASTGQMMVVEAALSHLSGIGQADVARQMYQRNPAHFRALFRRSGLPQGCYGVLRAACDVVVDMRETGLDINSSEFGTQMLEALMTRYEDMPATERARQIEFLGRYAEENVRRVAKRLKVDLLRAA